MTDQQPNPWAGLKTEAEAIAAPVETEEQFIARRNAEIQEWLVWKQRRTLSEAEEMAKRKTVTATCFPTPKKGTQRADIGSGYNIKLVYKLNYKLGETGKLRPDETEYKVYDQVMDVEEKIRALGAEACFIVDRLIKWSPDLSESEYKKLGETAIGLEIKGLIDEILTVTPASPSLEFEEPKQEK